MSALAADPANHELNLANKKQNSLAWQISNPTDHQTNHQIIQQRSSQWKHTAVKECIYPSGSSIWLSMPHPQIELTRPPYRLLACLSMPHPQIELTRGPLGVPSRQVASGMACHKRTCNTTSLGL